MFGLVVYLGELFLFGGRPYTNDVWRSHNGGTAKPRLYTHTHTQSVSMCPQPDCAPCTELWTPVTDHALWSARAGLGAAYLANNAVPGGVFVVLGGDSETSDGLSDVWLARPDGTCADAANGTTQATHSAHTLALASAV